MDILGVARSACGVQCDDHLLVGNTPADLSKEINILSIKIEELQDSSGRVTHLLAAQYQVTMTCTAEQ